MLWGEIYNLVGLWLMVTSPVWILVGGCVLAARLLRHKWK